MAIWQSWLAWWRSRGSSVDSHSELLALARMMHPEASDAQLIAQLLEHAPDGAPSSADPFSSEHIDIAAYCQQTSDDAAGKIEANLRRLRGDAFPDEQKRVILTGTIALLNRLYGLSDRLDSWGDQATATSLRQRAQTLEETTVAVADQLGLDVVARGDV